NWDLTSGRLDTAVPRAAQGTTALAMLLHLFLLCPFLHEVLTEANKAYGHALRSEGIVQDIVQ
ncbi:hypothetical protein HAX54_015259, partial [Datura stramonium]|nr:hypothetical protein [Datura stramonium]